MYIQQVPTAQCADVDLSNTNEPTVTEDVSVQFITITFTANFTCSVHNCIYVSA